VEIDNTIKALLFALELAGAFALSVSGATAAIRKQLDMFGVLLLSFVAATFGGILRDLVIGATPPAAIASSHYLIASLVAGAVTYTWYPLLRKLHSPVLVFDAIGLALFVVAGTQKAFAFGISPVMAAMLGMLTGIGGGIARDLLVADVPAVLRTDFYALAALAGASVMVIGDALHFPASASALTGAALCLALRLLAIRHGWSLPARHDVSEKD
jgi:uncharacterized membrane protein YeiH